MGQHTTIANNFSSSATFDMREVKMAATMTLVLEVQKLVGSAQITSCHSIYTLVDSDTQTKFYPITDVCDQSLVPAREETSFSSCFAA